MPPVKQGIDVKPKLFLAVLISWLLLTSWIALATPTGGLENSDAFNRYIKRQPTEISKLVYLIDRFRDMNAVIIYDGNEHKADEAADYARRYLRQYYDTNQTAVNFIKLHAVRSSPGGEIIYIKFPDGKVRPLKDVLLEELKMLNDIYSSVNK